MAYMNVSTGFSVNGDTYIDERLLLTKKQMKGAYDEWFMPQVYIAYCLDDKQWYEYNENNEEDPETGFYRPIPAGIVKDVRIEGVSILDSEGVADFEFPVEDVLVDGTSVLDGKKARIDLSNFQEKLIAGENITISDSNVISATVPELKEGEGIIITSEGKVKIDEEVVPKKDELEELVEDLGFVAADTLNAILNNYYSNSETYNKEEVNELISQISGGITLEVVAVLPITGDPSKIYLVRREVGSNVYDQWIWFNNNWVQVGSTEVDLSQYYTKDEIDDLLEDKQDKLTEGQGISISRSNIISVDTEDLPQASASTSGLVKIDNVTIKKNSDGQLYSVGGGSGGGDYYEGDNIYFTTNAGKTLINAEGYTAGDGITISSSKKISAKVDDQTIHTNRYGELCMDAVPIEAGDGININADGEISIDPAEVAAAIDLSDYQKKLVAGNNIVIDPVSNVISSTGGGGGGGSTNWGQIGGTLSNQPDLMAALNAKADDGDIPTKVSDLVNDVPYATQASVTSLASNKQDKLTAGANITISADNVISATGGGGGPTEVNFSDLVGSPLDNAALAAQINAAKQSPTVNNGSFTFRANSASVGGGSVNQSANTSFGITLQKNGMNIAPSIASNNATYNIKMPTFSLNGTVLTITDND